MQGLSRQTTIPCRIYFLFTDLSLFFIISIIIVIIIVVTIITNIVITIIITVGIIIIIA